MSAILWALGSGGVLSVPVFAFYLGRAAAAQEAERQLAPLRERIRVLEAASSGPAPEPAPRRRSMRVGDLVPNSPFDGSRNRLIKDPDSKVEALYNTEERIDGATARLNEYHDDAASLSAQQRTTWAEWTRFSTDLSGFALRHLSVARQTDVIQLVEKRPRRLFGRGSSEAARESFADAAALISSWLDGAGLTRFDLQDRPTEST